MLYIFIPEKSHFVKNSISINRQSYAYNAIIVDVRIFDSICSETLISYVLK